MTHSVMKALIYKDLHLARWVVIGAFVFGLAMIAIIPFGRIAFFVCGSLLIVDLILLNAGLVQVLVTAERKDKAYRLVLSFPVSFRQYLNAKIAANMLGYFVTWSTLTLAFIAMILLTEFPNGFIPFAMTLLIYSIGYYLSYLAVCLLTDNVICSTAVVVIGNVSYSFIIPALLQFKTVTDHVATNNVVWAPVMLWIMGVTMAIGMVSLVSVYLYQSRKRDLI